MKKVRIVLKAVLLLVTISAASLAAAPNSKPYTIGVLAKRGAEECISCWQATAEYLTHRIEGAEFSIEPLGFQELYSAVQRGEHDFILTNPSMYVSIEQFFGAGRIVTLKNRVGEKGYSFFGGLLLARADNDAINAIEDLRGVSFAAVSEYSFGGWQMGLREIEEHGITPKKDFTSLEFLGTHDAVVFAVLKGEVDAGTVRTDTLERMEEEGLVKADDFKVLHAHGGETHIIPFRHSTRAYPEWPLAKAAHTEDELAQRVAVELLKMPAESEAAKKANIIGWTIPLNYQPVHDCLKELRLGPYLDYGKVTLGEALRQYWYIVLLVGFFVIAVIIVAGIIYNLKEKVEKTKAFFQNVIDGIPEYMMVLDLDFTILYANERAKRGKSGLNPVGKKQKCFEVSHGYSRECAEMGEVCPVREVIKTKKPMTVLHEHVHPSGELFYVEVTAAPLINEKGEVYQIIEFSEDVTARVKAERDLVEAKRQAEAATEAKSQFLANMSHEIRTPMNGVLGMADLLLKTELPEEQEEYVRIIKSSAEGLLTIIDDILDISKIEAGRMELEAVEFELSPFLETINNLMLIKAREKGLNYEYQGGPSLPDYVEGDPGRIRQVLINLIGNAIKFTDTGNVVLTVKVEEKHEKSVKISFSVKDTGIGISKEEQERLFTPFTQADASITRQFGGTGLGLSISRKLCHIMGGDLEVDSEPGRGSEFYFTLELGLSKKRSLEKEKGEEVKEKELKEQTAPEKKNKEDEETLPILVAEDNAINQKVAERFLDKLGYTVDIAQNGREAVEAVKKKDFKLVFMDVQMPEMDGFEATKKIREHLAHKDPHGERLPIIAMTAHVTEGYRDKCIAAGMDDYISKPMTMKLLKQVLDNFVL